MPEDNNNIDSESRYDFQTDNCAVRSCKWVSHQPNNEGALDLITQGGYGDFTDYYDELPVYFRLCHKHAHKFASWLNNPKVLRTHSGHSHNGSEPGFWFGHIGWEQYTWMSYLNRFFFNLRKAGVKDAFKGLKNQFQSHKAWSRKNINDMDSPVVISKFLFKFFFLTNSYKGIVYSTKNHLRWSFERWIEKKHRNNVSLAQEVWNKVIKGELSKKELDLFATITKANSKSAEEE